MTIQQSRGTQWEAAFFLWGETKSLKTTYSLEGDIGKLRFWVRISGKNQHLSQAGGSASSPPL